VKDGIKNMIQLLKLGGWLQLVESDHSIVGRPAIGDLFALLCHVIKVMEMNPRHAPQPEGWFKELGHKKVGCKVFDVPLGRRNRKRR
jgi:hypothetical protein